MTGRRRRAGRVSQNAIASGHSQVYQAGGDQHVHHHYPADERAAAPQVMVTLPATPAHLVGRDTEIGELLELLAPGEAGTAAVVVSAVHGLAGIGKTALALRAAHEAVARDWFAGGALFVPMGGYDPAGSVTAAQAVGMLLRALGVDDEKLPSTHQEQLALYQSELARRARQSERVLVLADDVSAAEQVRSLIPAHGTHRMLVTSRDTMTSLGARLVAVDELAPDAAADLISHALTLARPDDPRPAAEAAALTEVVAHCGRLPLALQIAAAILVGDPGRPIAALAADLADKHTRLDQLNPHQQGDGQSAPIRATFELSYRRLPAQQQKLFRLVGCNPGPDMATDTAARLIRQPFKQTRRVLAALARAGLLTESPAGSGRWRMHDLIKSYAAELAHAGDGDEYHETVPRLLRLYETTTTAALAHIRPLRAGPLPVRFHGRNEALAWLDAERPNLVAIIALAVVTSPPIAISLATSLIGYLDIRHYYDDAVITSRHALIAARELHDQHAEGEALSQLAPALARVGRVEEAIDTNTKAAAVFHGLGDRKGKGRALGNRGLILSDAGKFEEAIDTCAQAATIFHELGDRTGEGTALHNRAHALEKVTRFEEAIDAYAQAATIFHELGDQHHEGEVLRHLGQALARVGRVEEAIDTCTNAATVFHELGDRHGEGDALTWLGAAQAHVGHVEEAIDTTRRAATIFNGLEDWQCEAEALIQLSHALGWAGRPDEEAIGRVKTIFDEFGVRPGIGEALHTFHQPRKMMRRGGRVRSWWQAITSR